MTNLIPFPTHRIRSTVLSAALKSLREHGERIASTIDALEAKGWTVTGFCYETVVCSHPQVYSFKGYVGLSEAVGIQKIMGMSI